jgi:hypothetical protein
MSERAPQHEQHEKFEAKAETEPRREAAPEHQPRHEKELPPVKELAQNAKEEAVVGKDLVGHEKHRPAQSDMYVTKELKQQTWNRSMTRVRKHLSVPSKAFSKVIHQPVVDSVSRISEKTVARPSGFLMGSVFAFLGSSVFLWIARHYGFAYNYLLFFLFFVVGFAVGLIVEALLRVLHKSKA